MSAINGLYERLRPKASSRVLAVSLATMADYGRNGSNRWVGGAVGLGCQQTALVPESSGEELPWHDVVTETAVTADMRLDNRRELLTALGLPEWTTLPDNRLIVGAWQKWGPNCPCYLVGDFAFAIWDARQRTLFCARDHIGARPLYYCLTPERFVFASDLRGVLAVPEVSDRLDEDYVAAMLLEHNFYLTDRTYFNAVRKLQPGYSLTVSPDRARLERYWFPANAPAVRHSTDAGYAEAARDIYTQAVRDRLRTSSPVGVHLSGGLDSSSVAVLAARERRRQGQSPPAVFCWQPPPDDDPAIFWEHLFVEAVCRQEGLSAQYCPMTTDHTLAVLQKDPTLEPVTSTLIAEHTIQRRASAQGIRLILSGWGGDEGLSSSGRGYLSELLLRGRWRELHRQSRLRTNRPWRCIAREALLLLCPDRLTALEKISTRSWRGAAETRTFIHPDFLRETTRLRSMPCRQAGVRSTLFWAWEHGGLTERIESWHAQGAGHGVAYAYPMLDRRLLEFVAGLPSEQLVGGKWRRWLMRRATEGILPDDLRWHEDKSDPVGWQQGMSVAQQTLGLIGQQLAAAPALPTRARYVDMPRLLQRLRPESVQESRTVAYLLKTVQFLDFEHVPLTEPNVGVDLPN
jgi:asparagine synthase (glutamine-hydrolysing)